MKKLLSLVIGAAVIGVFAKADIFAAQTDTFVINVTCAREMSVNVTTATAAGERDAIYTATISSNNLPTNWSTVIPTPLAIWNNSPASAASIQNYNLQVTGGSTGLLPADGAGAWNTTTGSGAADTWLLASVFTKIGASINTAEYTADAADLIYKTSPKAWVATGIHSPSTGTERYATETAHPRNTGTANLFLWIGVGTPSATSSSGYNPSFTVTVGAE
ncbi:MAG: hypothetical protein QME32_07580 [Endomicrobiia bacterium]|nr:hypothetical protein [Endomicrobiia bacterium]